MKYPDSLERMVLEKKLLLILKKAVQDKKIKQDQAARIVRLFNLGCVIVVYAREDMKIAS